MLLVGPVGVGKSFLAQALSYAAVRAGHTVRFAPADLYFCEMSQGRVDRSVDKTFRSFLSPDLLILDDLGLQRLDQQQSIDCTSWLSPTKLPKSKNFRVGIPVGPVKQGPVASPSE